MSRLVLVVLSIFLVGIVAGQSSQQEDLEEITTHQAKNPLSSYAIQYTQSNISYIQSNHFRLFFSNNVQTPRPQIQDFVKLLEEKLYPTFQSLFGGLEHLAMSLYLTEENNPKVPDGILPIQSVQVADSLLPISGNLVAALIDTVNLNTIWSLASLGLAQIVSLTANDFNPVQGIVDGPETLPGAGWLFWQYMHVNFNKGNLFSRLLSSYSRSHPSSNASLAMFLESQPLGTQIPHRKTLYLDFIKQTLEGYRYLQPNSISQTHPRSLCASAQVTSFSKLTPMGMIANTPSKLSLIPKYSLNLTSLGAFAVFDIMDALESTYFPPSATCFSWNVKLSDSDESSLTTMLLAVPSGEGAQTYWTKIQGQQDASTFCLSDLRDASLMRMDQLRSQKSRGTNLFLVLVQTGGTTSSTGILSSASPISFTFSLEPINLSDSAYMNPSYNIDAVPVLSNERDAYYDSICPENYEKCNNCLGKCMSKCPSGWLGVASVCYKPCADGWQDRGLICWIDAHITIADNGSCPWYDKCGKGCSKCPDNTYTNDGCTCRRDVKSYTKENQGRSFADHICRDGDVRIADEYRCIDCKENPNTPTCKAKRNKKN